MSRLMTIATAALILVGSVSYSAWAQFTDVGGHSDVQESGLPLGGGTLTGSLVLSDDVALSLGSSSDSTVQWDTGQTNDSVVWGVGNTSRTIIISEQSDVDVDFGHANQSNPAIFIQSSDATSTSDFVSIYHDQTHGYINQGSPTGTLRFQVNGSDAFVILSSAFQSNVGGGPSVVNATTTSTAPGFRPRQSDSNTGVGSNGDDQLSLIAGGQEKIRITTSGYGAPRSQTTLAAAATTFAVTSNVMEITGDGGANTVATITGATSGQVLVIQFVDGLVTITDDNSHAADSVDLSAAFTSADDSTLSLVYDGTSWYETSRSVN